jgi:hypothetical protein
LQNRFTEDFAVTICAFVKRFYKSFLRRNGLQNRFTEDFKSAIYAGAEYISFQSRVKLIDRLRFRLYEKRRLFEPGIIGWKGTDIF